MIKVNNTNISNVYFSRLPREYQEVEYLESTGTQYIDTGYKVSNIKVTIKGAYLKYSTLSKNPWGVDTPGSPRQMHGNIWGDGFYWGNSRIIDVPQALNTKYICVAECDGTKVKLTLNGIEYNYTGVNGWNGSAVNDYIFATNLGTEPAYILIGRVYYYMIYDNDVLVRNMIPCYRKSDNVAGMYDLVSGTFYTNEGTGTFIVGNKSGIKLDHIYYNGTLIYGESENILLDKNNEELFDKNNEQLIEGD